jgi:zinc transport system ATP-binding protein
MNNILTVKDLSVTYSGKMVISDINFIVEDGDFLVIFGENGSGKSSLIKTLLGLKAPSDGKIIFGEGVKHSEIGYLPQMTAEQKDFPASAMEVVLSGCLNSMGLKPFYGKKEKALAKKNMELLSVYDLKNECFRTLSGGQKQRVLLARALCAAKKNAYS